MKILNKIFEIFRIAELPENERWEYAQSKENEYWNKFKPSYMPWLYRLNRFGYAFEFPSSYTNSISCSDITKKFTFIKIPETPIVADVGCGPSGIGFSLIHNGKTYCVDPLLDTYKLIDGYKRHIFEKLDDSKQLIQAAGEYFAIPEEADIVFCLNVLDHAKDPALLIRNIHSQWVFVSNG